MPRAPSSAPPQAHMQPRQPVREQYLTEGPLLRARERRGGTLNGKEPEYIRLIELTNNEAFRLLLNN